MKKEYESFVKKTCYLQNWKAAPPEEVAGAVGVALVFAFIRGTEPVLENLAMEVGVTTNVAEEPYNRLLVNGIFSNRYNARNDAAFTATAKDVEVEDKDGKKITLFKGSRVTECAWQIVAGIAGGLSGLRD